MSEELEFDYLIHQQFKNLQKFNKIMEFDIFVCFEDWFIYNLFSYIIKVKIICNLAHFGNLNKMLFEVNKFFKKVILLRNEIGLFWSLEI